MPKIMPGKETIKAKAPMHERQLAWALTNLRDLQSSAYALANTI
jgi:hypothetical protein